MSGLGASIWSWASILSAVVVLMACFWDGSPLYVGAPGFLGVPLLLAARHPG
jgi:hypothetical protein